MSRNERLSFLRWWWRRRRRTQLLHQSRVRPTRRFGVTVSTASAARWHGAGEQSQNRTREGDARKTSSVASRAKVPSHADSLSVDFRRGKQYFYFMEKLLTTTEAAAILGITEQAVTMNCRDGDLPGAVQPWGKGRGWLIPRSAVLARQRKRLKNQLNPGGRPRKSLSA